MSGLSFLFLLTIFSHLFIIRTYGNTCDQSEFKKIVSECDENGNFWIFNVPKNIDKCPINYVNYLLNNCDKTCSPGYYLASNKECKKCNAGSSSSGNVLKFTEFPTLPKGFIGDRLLSFSSDIETCQPLNHPLGTGVFAWNDHIRINAIGKCFYNLAYSTKNLQSGTITFEYQITDDSYNAYFAVRNISCVLRPDSNNLLPYTYGENLWNRYTLDIKAGMNHFHWAIGPKYTFYSSEYPGIMKLRNITITGTQPQIECQPCEPGYYAERDGMEACLPCPANYYSVNSSSCIKCNEDQFSDIGSSICKPREDCQLEDYEEFYGECSSDEKVIVEYRLREPVICKETNKNIKPKNVEKKCKHCPEGYFKNAYNKCEMCNADLISTDDFTSCKPCSKDEAPILGIKINEWFHQHESIKYESDNPKATQGMILRGDHVAIGEGSRQNIMETVTVQTNLGYLVANPIYNQEKWIYEMKPLFGSYFSIEFELDCYGNCTMSIVQNIDFHMVTLKTWFGRTGRNKFKFDVKTPRLIATLIKFSKSDMEYIQNWNSKQHYRDRLKIYSIETINTEGKSAIGCKKCPLGVINDRCKPCLEGFLSKKIGINGTYCDKCPENSILVGDAMSDLTVEEACHQCPPGSKAVKNSYCVVDTHPYFETSGRSYHLEKLMNVQTVHGPKLFDKDSNQYQHLFKFSLTFGDRDSGINCHSNSSSVGSEAKVQVCKITKRDILSNSENSQESVNLGTYLDKIQPTNSSKEFEVQINNILYRMGWLEDFQRTDLHYFFKNDRTSASCPNGIQTIITLRCSLNMFGFHHQYGSSQENDQSIGRFELPPNCVDGTCDGCNYHLMWISYESCPICRDIDYYNFPEPCENGKQKIQKYAPFGCRSLEQDLTETIPCPYLSRTGKVVVIFVILVILFLIFLIISFYYTNQKLKYKYQKLVEYNQNHKNHKIQEDTGCGVIDEVREDPYSNQGYTSNEHPISSKISNVFESVKINFQKKRDDQAVLTFDDGNDPTNYEL